MAAGDSRGGWVGRLTGRYLIQTTPPCWRMDGGIHTGKWVRARKHLGESLSEELESDVCIGERGAGPEDRTGVAFDGTFEFGP